MRVPSVAVLTNIETGTMPGLQRCLTQRRLELGGQLSLHVVSGRHHGRSVSASWIYENGELPDMQGTVKEVIRLENAWKIFGDNAQQLLRERDATSCGKREMLSKYGCVVAVADVSFSVNEGEIFCIMGLSGSGKSTLVRLLNRLLEPTVGSILVDGQDITTLSNTALRELRNRKISMVFQHFGLMPHRTVRDNVALPLEIAGMPRLERWEKAQEAIEAVNLRGWEDRRPNELSGGMQQRVGLARALAGDAEILLMDEPFSALDPLIRRQLQDEFTKLIKKYHKTAVFITHDLDEAIRIGTRIAIMNEGKIVQIGQPADIIMNPIDDYVADFVSGISKSKFVTAHSLMRAPQVAEQEFASSLMDDFPEVAEDTTMGQLIDIILEVQTPIHVIRDGKRVGVITASDVLKNIRGDDLDA